MDHCELATQFFKIFLTLLLNFSICLICVGQRYFDLKNFNVSIFLTGLVILFWNNNIQSYVDASIILI